MTNMETITLPHLSDHPLFVGLFEDVQNAPFLRKQLLEGNTDFEYAFLDQILSRDHVLAACFKAINDAANNRLKSRNVHSEIVFSMSPNNNIAESFRRFGITDDTKHVLAIKVGLGQESTEQSVRAHLEEHVQGKSVEFTNSNIARLHDLPRLRKIYKFDMPKDGQLTVATSFVLGTMALKGS
ncbi:hypothetical protein MBLNU457_3118t2 [Dothideomycetes sp. NU457]